MYRHLEDRLADGDRERYCSLVQRRLAHEPIAYILGWRAFYDIELWVDRRALIPRPETEHLVEEALRWAHATSLAHPRLADVGTGSGALAIVLARHLPGARVWAVDISWEALQVAARNVRRWGLEGHILLLQGDLMAAIGMPCDLIVANLPYVPAERLPTLPADVADYEPRIALDGGKQGLACIERLLAQAPLCLARPGLLLLEVDDSHAHTVASLAGERLPEADIRVLADLAGLARVVRIEMPPTRGPELPL